MNHTPEKPGSPGAIQGQSERLVDPPSPTVLVIDDNEANRSLALDTLEDEGFRVLLAASGAVGLSLFAECPPDCVLLDVRMPDMDGFDVCQRMRAIPAGADVPILFLTGLRDVETFDKALSVGGDDFVTKPVRPTELVIRVKAALKLRRMHAELRGHYALLKQQRDDLIRLQLQKERLIAFVVHDLKNPVNSIDLHAQFLLKHPELSDNMRSSATQIRAAARQLSRMIMNLLDVSKADEGKLSPDRTDVDLVALVDELSQELGPSTRRHDITIAAHLETLRIRGDRELLRRLLTNLVENAVRHAPPSSVVAISSRSVGGGLELAVKDEGKGVPWEVRESIFDPFKQAENGHTTTRGGQGLGLTFCKLVAEAHGGNIQVSDGSPGAVFTVTLPHA